MSFHYKEGILVPFYTDGCWKHQAFVIDGVCDDIPSNEVMTEIVCSYVEENNGVTRDNIPLFERLFNYDGTPEEIYTMAYNDLIRRGKLTGFVIVNEDLFNEYMKKENEHENQV